MRLRFWMSQMNKGGEIKGGEKRSGERMSMPAAG